MEKGKKINYALNTCTLIAGIVLLLTGINILLGITWIVVGITMIIIVRTSELHFKTERMKRDEFFRKLRETISGHGDTK